MPTKGSEENTKIEFLDYIFFVLYFETLLKVLPLEEKEGTTPGISETMHEIFFTFYAKNIDLENTYYVFP